MVWYKIISITDSSATNAIEVFCHTIFLYDESKFLCYAVKQKQCCLISLRPKISSFYNIKFISVNTLNMFY